MKPEPRIPILTGRPLPRAHDRPSEASLSYDAFIARLTSPSGGHGSPVNSISTLIGPVVPALLDDPEHGLEVDVALADRREIPDPALAALVLEVAVDHLRQGDRQIVDRLHPAVEFDIRRVVVDQHVRPADAFQNRNRRPRPTW